MIYDNEKDGPEGLSRTLTSEDLKKVSWTEQQPSKAEPLAKHTLKTTYVNKDLRVTHSKE